MNEMVLNVIFFQNHIELRDITISGARSIGRYREIEAKSGIEFYQEVGFLSIGPPTEDHFLEQKDYEKVEKMEHLYWSQDSEATFQPREAGHISPRNLVKAQKFLAEQNNCHILGTIHIIRMQTGWVVWSIAYFCLQGGLVGQRQCLCEQTIRKYVQ